MKGCLVIFVMLFALLMAGLALPVSLIGSGVRDFEGDERRMTQRASFYVTTYYGESFLDYGEYIGPALVLGWSVKGVEECPALPPGEEPEEDSYRAYAGASAEIRAYTLFGVPRGEVDVTCGGRRKWEPYF